MILSAFISVHQRPISPILYWSCKHNKEVDLLSALSVLCAMPGLNPIWQINFEDSAVKELGKLDKQIQKNILHFLRDRVAVDDDPRRFGQALRNNLAGLWKYRVGDYRIIYTINDHELTVLVVPVGHRRQIYGKH